MIGARERAVQILGGRELDDREDDSLAGHLPEVRDGAGLDRAERGRRLARGTLFYMTDMGAPLDRYAEVETGQPFTLQNPRLLKVELSETTVMARNGAMVAYQGDVHFEHKGGGLGRLLKKAATGESLRLMQATGSGELFLASNAMLVHVLTLHDDSLTVNGQNILAFEAGTRPSSAGWPSS